MSAAVQAVQFTEAMAEGREPLPAGVVKRRYPFATPPPGSGLLVYARFVVQTAQGERAINVGDWIVTYPSGSFYVCPAGAFAVSYDEAPPKNPTLPVSQRIR